MGPKCQPRRGPPVKRFVKRRLHAKAVFSQPPKRHDVSLGMCLAFVCPHRLITLFFTRTTSIASVSCVQIWRRRPGLGSVGSAQTSLERLFVKRCQIYVKSGKEGTPGTEREREGSGAGVELLRAVVSDQAATDQAAKVGLRWRRIGLRQIRHAVWLLNCL